jgi:hypothetical protein
VELGRHLGAAAEDPLDPQLLERGLLAQRLEELGGREQAPDVLVGLEQGQGLVDDVLLVPLHLPDLAGLDQLDHPAGVEVDLEADPAAELAEVLHGQAQTARAGGPELQPVRALRKELVGKGRAELLVVDAEVVDADAGLGHPGRAPGLEDRHRTIGVAERHPLPHRAPAEPLVLEVPEPVEIGVALHLPARVPARPLRPVQPEGRPRGRVVVPAHDLSNPGVERRASGPRPGLETHVTDGSQIPS